MTLTLNKSFSGSGVAAAEGYVFIKKQTISTSITSIDFINGSNDVVFDSTYKTYMFVYEVLQASGEITAVISTTTDGTNFNVAGNGVTIDPHLFNDDGTSSLDNNAQANLTTGLYGPTMPDSSVTEGSSSGFYFFYDPANTTQYKNATLEVTQISAGSPSGHWSTGGRMAFHTWQTTSAITGVRLAVASGTLNEGSISLFGLKTS